MQSVMAVAEQNVGWYHSVPHTTLSPGYVWYWRQPWRFSSTTYKVVRCTSLNFLCVAVVLVISTWKKPGTRNFEVCEMQNLNQISERFAMTPFHSMFFKRHWPKFIRKHLPWFFYLCLVWIVHSLKTIKIYFLAKQRSVSISFSIILRP